MYQLLLLCSSASKQDFSFIPCNKVDLHVSCIWTITLFGHSPQTLWRWRYELIWLPKNCLVPYFWTLENVLSCFLFFNSLFTMSHVGSLLRKMYCPMYFSSASYMHFPVGYLLIERNNKNNLIAKRLSKVLKIQLCVFFQFVSSSHNSLHSSYKTVAQQKRKLHVTASGFDRHLKKWKAASVL